MKLEEIKHIITKNVRFAHVVDEWGMNAHYTIKGIEEAAFAIHQLLETKLDEKDAYSLRLHELIAGCVEEKDALKEQIASLTRELQAKDKLLNLYKERNPGLIINK